jgi:hypothetical protein
MTTDYRALCAELFAAIQLYTGQNPAAADIPSNELVGQLMNAMAATATALAQPEPVGPTPIPCDETTPMTDTFRALCAELADELDEETGYTRKDGTRIIHPTVAEARAALAQPEPVGVTDFELVRAIPDWWPCTDAPRYDLDDSIPEQPLFAVFQDDIVEYARAVLARWGRPAITPIPVSERLPGPKDCAPWPDEPAANHWCWCWLGREDEGCWMWSQASAMGKDADELEWSLAGGGWTHWLPAHALPLPPSDHH